VERAGRLNRDQRLAGDAAAPDQTLEFVDALVQRRQRDRFGDQAALTARSQTRFKTLPGSIATTSVSIGRAF
jgi:hypothetical protein